MQLMSLAAQERQVSFMDMVPILLLFLRQSILEKFNLFQFYLFKVWLKSIFLRVLNWYFISKFAEQAWTLPLTTALKY